MLFSNSKRICAILATIWIKYGKMSENLSQWVNCYKRVK